jgi:pseudouridine synthase
MVNDVVLTQPGTKIDPERDRVAVDGKPVVLQGERHYFILNKPAGVVTTLKDRHAEKTVAEIVSELPWRLYPVGRLDKDTTGLLIMTDDGDVAQALMHPSHLVEKVYRVYVQGIPSEITLEKLRRGVLLTDGMTSPAKVEIFKRLEGQTILEMTIHEGRKRQVRRMVGTVGHPVIQLTRIRVGPLSLGNLPVGAYRALTAGEVEALRKIAELVKGRADGGGTLCYASKTGMNSQLPPSGRKSASISITKEDRGDFYSGSVRKTAPSKSGRDKSPS